MFNANETPRVMMISIAPRHPWATHVQTTERLAILVTDYETGDTIWRGGVNVEAGDTLVFTTDIGHRISGGVNGIEYGILYYRRPASPCPDCAHTTHPGFYVGALVREPCPTCNGKAQL